MTEGLQDAVNALALGSVYALLALGVALIFSILRLINFAHGELLTVAGFTLYLLHDAGLPFGVTLPGAIASAALVAVLLERTAFRPLRNARSDVLLVASFALSVILQSGMRIAFGSRPQPLHYPDWVGTRIELGSLPLSLVDVITVAVMVATLVAMTLFMRRSVTGIALRAAATDFDTTRLMGIRANRVIVGAFVVSGILAGLAAILYFAQSPFVEPTSGLTPVTKGFIATIIGGLGSLGGAVIGAFLLAGLEIGFEATAPTALNAYGDAFIFAFVIVVLLGRPQGLFGVATTEGRA